MAYAKYTFFEAATQHGYVMALMSGRIGKSREFCQIIVDPTRGRVFQVFKTVNPDKPFFEFVIPERMTTESTFMWRDKAKKQLDSQWKAYEKGKEEARAARSGGVIGASVASTPSKTGSSSTDAPPKLASLIGPYGVVEPATVVSVPEPSIPASLPIEPPSSPASAPVSRKSGSKPRSSSGASKAKSGSATARAASTPAKS